MNESNVAVPNLHQRLIAAIAQVGRVKATGKTAQSVKTMSIADVEGAIKQALTDNGIVARTSFNERPIWNPEAKPAIWEVSMTIRLANADVPEDCFEDQICDVGSNPSAAVSWALKRYWKAMFHLSDADEHAGQSYEPAIPGSRRAGNFREPQRQAAPITRPAVQAQPLSIVPGSDLATLNATLPQGHRWFGAKLAGMIGHPNQDMAHAEMRTLHERHCVGCTHYGDPKPSAEAEAIMAGFEASENEPGQEGLL